MIGVRFFYVAAKLLQFALFAILLFRFLFCACGQLHNKLKIYIYASILLLDKAEASGLVKTWIQLRLEVCKQKRRTKTRY